MSLEAALPRHLFSKASFKHGSSILRQSSNRVCGFSMMEQVRLWGVWPTENCIGFSMNHIQGWMTVWEFYSHALDKRRLDSEWVKEKGYKTISISEIEAKRRRSSESECMSSWNLHAFYGVTAPLSRYCWLARPGKLLNDSFLFFGGGGVKWHGIIGRRQKMVVAAASTGPICFSDTGLSDNLATVTFFVPKRTSLYWKSSDRVTIAYSDTFSVSQHCHCNR